MLLLEPTPVPNLIRNRTFAWHAWLSHDTALVAFIACELLSTKAKIEHIWDWKDFWEICGNAAYD